MRHDDRMNETEGKALAQGMNVPEETRECHRMNRAAVNSAAHDDRSPQWSGKA